MPRMVLALLVTLLLAPAAQAAPALSVTGPEVVPSSGAVTLTVDAGPATGTIDWGDGTVVALTTGDVSHTYAGPGTYTVTVTDGASSTATHTLSVATLTAPHVRPDPAPVTAPVAPAVAVLGAQATHPRARTRPRCRTLKLRSSLSKRRKCAARAVRAG